MTFDELKSRLNSMTIRELELLAQRCGLNMHTLYRTGKGKTKPHKSTVRTITEAIEQMEIQK